jgi:SAM-dependent methyltransferase
LPSRDTPDEPVFYGKTAWYYARYRRWYPPELIGHLQRLRAREHGRLLDLGCGTGQLLLQLANSFDHCVGIDPEPDMLREAARLAAERGVRNADWISAGASDLPLLEPQLGRFDLVTIGTAFHLMEPRSTLESLKRIVHPGGSVAVAYNGSPMWLHRDAWAKALRSVLESWLGPVSTCDLAVEGLRACEDAMRDLGYSGVQRWTRTYETTIDIDFVVGHIYSALSPTQIPRDQTSVFEQQLRKEIAAVAPSGRVTETVVVRSVVGRANAG